MILFFYGVTSTAHEQRERQALHEYIKIDDIIIYMPRLCTARLLALKLGHQLVSSPHSVVIVLLYVFVGLCRHFSALSSHKRNTVVIVYVLVVFLEADPCSVPIYGVSRHWWWKMRNKRMSDQVQHHHQLFAEHVRTN